MGLPGCHSPGFEGMIRRAVPSSRGVLANCQLHFPSTITVKPCADPSHPSHPATRAQTPPPMLGQQRAMCDDGEQRPGTSLRHCIPPYPFCQHCGPERPVKTVAQWARIPSAIHL